MNANDLVLNHQFGFRKHKKNNLIKRTFENKQFAIFIDIPQAFDKVWHEGLLFKISQFLLTNGHLG